jgi:bifunctional non-homologous end joining protein LigD
LNFFPLFFHGYKLTHRGLLASGLGRLPHHLRRALRALLHLQTRLKRLIRRTQPYAKQITHCGTWVEPSLLAEIEYRAKSAEGKVRHPFYKGIREDL